jgi:sialic acid synthase SpsE
MASSIYHRLKNKENPFFIVEISSNHNGSVERAKKMIDVAVEAGADAVKFQTWTKSSLSSKIVYEGKAKLAAENSRISLTKEKFMEIKNYCDEQSIIFCASAFSEEEADMLTDIGVPFMKFASLDITNLELIEYVAKKGLPIIISGGMSTIGEIETALETIYATGNKEVVLLYCVSNYPTQDNHLNLNRIKNFQQIFDISVGLSDHTEGRVAPVMAVALGACMIEKHIMLTDGEGCRERYFALPEKHLKELVDNVKRAPYMMEDQPLVSSREEKRQFKKMRRSLVTKKRLITGEILTKEDIAHKRPGTGISPIDWKFAKGRKLKVTKEIDEVVNWDDLI